MGDEQVGKSEVTLKLFEQVDDLRADTDVEGRDRFVTDNEFWTQDEARAMPMR